MKVPTIFLGYDTYERHRMVAKLANKNASSILDIGGGEGLLSTFLGKQVLVVNLTQGDVRANGLSIPFANSTFEIVSSLDVLEHIPKLRRHQFISELLRVGQKQVIICAPYGSEVHSKVEKQVMQQIEKNGDIDKMLAEHVLYGLPTLEEVCSYIPLEYKKEIYFSGFLNFSMLCFRIDYLFGIHSFKPIKILASIILNLFGNIVVFPLSMSITPRSNANRMFILITK
jgi:hypothetical protein